MLDGRERRERPLRRPQAGLGVGQQGAGLLGREAMQRPDGRAGRPDHTAARGEGALTGAVGLVEAGGDGLDVGVHRAHAARSLRCARQAALYQAGRTERPRCSASLRSWTSR